MIGTNSILTFAIFDISDNKNMRLRINANLQKAYNEALTDFKNDIKEFCVKRDVDYISISTDTPIETVLFKELLKVGLMS